MPFAVFQLQSSSLQKLRVSYPPADMNSRNCTVRHHVLVNVKSRDLRFVSFVFVVPSECRVHSRKPKRGYTSRDWNHSMNNGGSDEIRRIGWSDFSVNRQLVQHVSQCFDVHEPMLNRDVEPECREENRHACARESPEVRRPVSRRERSEFGLHSL